MEPFFISSSRLRLTPDPAIRKIKAYVFLDTTTGQAPVQSTSSGSMDANRTDIDSINQCSLLLSSRRRIAVMTFLVWSGKSPFIIHE